MNGVSLAAGAGRPAVDDEVYFDGILDGRYSLRNESRRADGRPRVFSCRTQRVSTDRMIVEGPVRGRLGEHVKAWIEHFDLLEGLICDVGYHTFTLRFSLGAKARHSFAKKITWVRRHVLEGLPDLRNGKRVPMPSLRPIIILGTGAIYDDSFVIDASPTGAAVSADIILKPGTRLALGCIVGTVVREIETGFAMRFDEKQEPETLRKVLGWQPLDRPKDPALCSLLETDETPGALPSWSNLDLGA